MLTQISTAATATSTSKQITYSGSTSATIYTVPSGKKFTGWFSSASSSGSLNINGSAFYAMSGTSSGAVIPQPLILLAGTVVTGAGQQVSLIGVEE